MTELIPRNNDEFCKLYGKYVADHVARLNKRAVSFADILQSVWLRLIEADVVGKFHARTAASRPEALTTEEVCQHYGITTESWTVTQAAYQAGVGLVAWMPSPVAGDATSLDALWGADDVERYEATVYVHHEKVAEREEMLGRPTASHFRTYVQRAVHNAFANWVRTQDRRHKERPVDYFHDAKTAIFHDAKKDGVHLSQDDLFDAFFGTTDCVGQPAPTGSAVRMEAAVGATRTIHRMALGEFEADFVDLLQDGYTAAEACRKLKLSRATTYRVAAALQG